MNEMTVPTRYEHALTEALRAALGERCEIDDVAHCRTNEATPVVRFVVTAADRQITDTGFGEVLFLEDRACNDNGWCEGDAILLLATAAGAAVLELCHGCPKYCDDETDASLSGTARFFDEVGVARGFATHLTGRARFHYCKSAMETALQHGLRVDARLVAQALLDVARNQGHAVPDSQRDGWLASFCAALVATVSATATEASS